MTRYGARELTDEEKSLKENQFDYIVEDLFHLSGSWTEVGVDQWAGVKLKGEIELYAPDNRTWLGEWEYETRVESDWGLQACLVKTRDLWYAERQRLVDLHVK
jgi:hypothetical protein